MYHVLEARLWQRRHGPPLYHYIKLDARTQSLSRIFQVLECLKLVLDLLVPTAVQYKLV